MADRFNVYSSLAYRSGVTNAISAPGGNGLITGISAAFSTGSLNGLEEGAILQNEVALHIKVSQRSSVSVSTQVAALRKLLFDHHTEHAEVVEKVKKVCALLFPFQCLPNG